MASNNPQESLQRAQFGQSMTNYAAIMNGFIAKGIPADDIKPRENVFTFNAWRAKGRIVKRGEHGVRCLTFIDAVDRKTGERKRRPWSTTVFHITQTEPIASRAVTYPDAATNTPDAWHEPRRAANIYETMTDEALAAIVTPARGKALVQLTEAECMAMMEQMRRANATVKPAELPAVLASVAEEAKTIDVTPTATLVKTKAAWIREAGYPIGQPAPMHLNCECGRQIRCETPGDITCACGIAYDRAGWITRPPAETPAQYNASLRRDRLIAKYGEAAARRSFPDAFVDCPANPDATPRERVLAGEPVSILDLMPDKIDARPRGPRVILNGQPLKPQLKTRKLSF